MIYQQIELFNMEGLLIDHAIGFTRVPDGLRLLLNEYARAYALHTAGCEIRFNLLSDQAVVHLQCSDALFPAIVEVYQGSFQTNWTIVGTGPTAIPVERSVTRELVRRLGTSGVFPYDPELTRILECVDTAGRTRRAGVCTASRAEPAAKVSCLRLVDHPRGDRHPAERHLRPLGCAGIRCRSDQPWPCRRCASGTRDGCVHCEPLGLGLCHP
jgi:hypothetical protein